MTVEPGELSGEIALVTGAAGEGCGRAIARVLLERGATVVVTDVHERRTEAATAELSQVGRAVAYLMDVADQHRVDEVIERVRVEIGEVTILVNNAAVNPMGGLAAVTPSEWDRAVAVNLTGPWYLTRAIVPMMQRAGHGAILNISSISPDVGGGGIEVAYAVTKGGIGALTRACAIEFGPDDIRCNTLSMGLVSDTRFVKGNPAILEQQRELSALPTLVDTTDIAEAAAFLVGPRSRSITGEVLNVAAGAYIRVSAAGLLI